MDREWVQVESGGRGGGGGEVRDASGGAEDSGNEAVEETGEDEGEREGEGESLTQITSSYCETCLMHSDGDGVACGGTFNICCLHADGQPVQRFPHEPL